MPNVHVLHTFRMGSRDAAIVNWFDVIPGEITTPQVLADEISGNYLAEMHQDATSGACIYTGCIVTDEFKAFKVTSARNAAGAAPGGMTPPNVSYLLRHNMVGTTSSGRNYLPGVPEAAVGDYGEVTAGTVTYINGQWASFMAKLVAAYPSLQHKIKRADGTFGLVESSAVDGKVATQRRRLRG